MNRIRPSSTWAATFLVALALAGFAAAASPVCSSFLNHVAPPGTCPDEVGRAAYAELKLGATGIAANRNGQEPQEPQEEPPKLSKEETAALNRAKRILMALETYRKRYGNYPQSLAQLGPPQDEPPSKKAARLITGQLAGGKAQGYVFRYKAMLRQDPEGAEKHEGFELKVRPEKYGSTGPAPTNRGRASFYADESAVIRITHDDRDPQPDDPPLEKTRLEC